jgi:hypothetical protein
VDAVASAEREKNESVVPCFKYSVLLDVPVGIERFLEEHGIAGSHKPDDKGFT